MLLSCRRFPKGDHEMYDLKFITKVCILLSHVAPVASGHASIWYHFLTVRITQPSCNVTGATWEHSLCVCAGA